MGVLRGTALNLYFVLGNTAILILLSFSLGTGNVFSVVYVFFYFFQQCLVVFFILQEIFYLLD